MTCFEIAHQQGLYPNNGVKVISKQCALGIEDKVANKWCEQEIEGKVTHKWNAPGIEGKVTCRWYDAEIGRSETSFCVLVSQQNEMRVISLF